MNAYMNINVRVLSASAQAQIKALQAQVAGLQKQLAAANATSASGGILGAAGAAKSRKSLGAVGNQIQWTGRQLQYNWTIPLLLAGGAATKFALDNEKAFTRVQKVYGDTDAAVQWFRKHQDQIPEGMNATSAAAAAQANELEALGEAFEALSERYGVNQKEVLETAGAWAAAGSSGVALAKSVDVSLKAAILGDMDLAKATESLIAIQAQYSLSTKELNFTLGELNAIENQTGISMQGLIDGFARSAGVAREAGVDVRHLGAMLAALVPATGTAANAGNALKTIISRLMSPTKDAADVMREFGVDTRDAAWQSSTAMDRLLILAGHMGDTLKKTGQQTSDTADDMYELSDSQKQVVASVLGSRYQMNRFLVLMRELGPEISYYETALDATADRSKVFATMSKELNAVLSSSPRRLQMVWATLQNGMADAIQPLIPYIIYLAHEIAQAVNWFSNLDPAVQKMALVMLVLLAAVGPLTKYLGSLLTLLFTLGAPIRVLTGLWKRLHTVTETVDGVTRTTTTTFRKMFASWLLAPFRFLFAGFGALIGVVTSAWTSMMGLTVVQSTITAVSGAFMAALGAIYAGGTAAVVGIWRTMWIVMAAIQSGAMGTLLRAWLVNIAYMLRGTTALSGMSMIVSSAMAAVGVAISTGWALITGYSFVAYQAISYGFGAMWGMMNTLMVAGQGALMSLMLTFRLMFLSGWTGLYLAMTAIPGKVYPLMIRMQMAFQSAMSTVMMAGGRVAAGIWAALHAGMMLVSRAFWTQVIRLWIAGALMLPRALAALPKLGSQIFSKTMWAITKFIHVGGLRILGIVGAIASAVILAWQLFGDNLKKIWSNTVEYFGDSTNAVTGAILRGWNALPQGVANALTAVARIVHDAAMQIYEWFSYINPWAHHSPSLVENVTTGTAEINARFGGMSSAIKNHVKGAYADIKAFGNAIKGLLKGAADFEHAQERAKIKKFAPGALKEYDQLARRLKTLQTDLATMENRVAKQEGVVKRYERALADANAELDKQTAKLDRLRERQQKWQDLLDEAQTRLSNFASAPIQGMGAMSDAIFENEMAQKRLRLEMMKMEEATGPLDDIKSRIEAINGMQELLRGEQASLRAAGAGSEILGQYDAEIAALEAQKTAQNDAAKAMDDMQKQLEALERAGQKLDLENSIAFDPLTRQIEKAAYAMEELPFAAIMNGIALAKSDIDNYTDKLDRATQAVNDQQLEVDKATKTRDLAQQALDREEATLARMKDRYDEVAEAISAVEEAMRGAASAAETMARAEEAAKKKKGGEGYVSPAVQNFRDAAGGNFANVGGAGIPSRKNWADQSAQIDKFTQDMADQAAKAFEDLNPFGSIKEKWGEFKGWFMDKWSSVSTAVKDMMGDIFSGTGAGDTLSGITDKFKNAWRTTRDWFDTEIWSKLVNVWHLFWPSIKEFFGQAMEGIKGAIDQISPEIGELWDEIKKLGPAFEGLWNFVKPILSVLGGIAAIAIKLVINVLAKTIKPAIEMIGDVISAIVQIVKGALQVVSGFFMLFAPGHFTEGLQKMVAGVGNIFKGMIDLVWGIIKGGVQIIVGIFWGIVDGIIDAARWLWDVLVGHSIIPDTINAIIDWFGKLADLPQWIWDHMVQPIIDFFVNGYTKMVDQLSTWWDGITGAWSNIKDGVKGWWQDNIWHPITEGISSWWTERKQVWSSWWDAIKNAWTNIKNNVKSWWHDNIWSPVTEGISSWWTERKQVWSSWWDAIKNAWSNISSNVKDWWFNNIWNPVKNGVTEWWGTFTALLGGWWGGIKSAWSNLLGENGVGGWWKQHVTDPIYNKITGVWSDITGWFNKNPNLLKDAVKGMVNGAISGLNKLIDGLNTVADKLPGLSFHIDPIDELAAGGVPQRRANRGFMTTGARAIVGEGKANYPEFVIPTDPTYRNRARGLLAAAAERIGVASAGIRNRTGGESGDASQIAANGSTRRNWMGTPLFAMGGILGGIKDAIGDLAGKGTDWVVNQGRDMVSFIVSPFMNKARDLIDKIGWNWLRGVGNNGLDAVQDWIKNGDKAYEDGYDQATGGPRVRSAQAWARMQAGKPYAWGSVGPDGYDCSGFMSAITNYLTGNYIHSRVGATASFPWGGFSPGAGPSTGFTIGSTANYGGSGIGHMAGTLGGLNVESRGGDGVVIGGSARGYNDPGFNKIAHLKMKYGGIIKRRTGGTTFMVTAGEAGVDEAFVPLPRNGGLGLGGETHNHFYGDLSFPNITDPNDADEFIRNLETLARD